MDRLPAIWKADHLGRIAELLDEQRPKTGEVDLRGFEWHYWDRLARSERVFPVGPRYCEVRLELERGVETLHGVRPVLSLRRDRHD